MAGRDDQTKSILSLYLQWLVQDAQTSSFPVSIVTNCDTQINYLPVLLMPGHSAQTTSLLVSSVIGQNVETEPDLFL